MDTNDLKGLKKRLEALYQPSDKDFSLVDVPDIRFVMIDGEGPPKGESHTNAVQWLFWAIYPLKLIGKERMGKYFIEPPLEGLWWADDVKDFIAGDQDKFKWRMMIVTADWVTAGATAEMLHGSLHLLPNLRRRLSLPGHVRFVDRDHEAVEVIEFALIPRRDRLPPAISA